jgi:hypothetical protein
MEGEVCGKITKVLGLPNTSAEFSTSELNSSGEASKYYKSSVYKS